ncbi:MAG: cell division protein FtsY [Candidatus Micrarchaeota archaeon]|nr:MAG: cell division protein FtsY [Candidatus Micrarchaeota archaeon]
MFNLLKNKIKEAIESFKKDEESKDLNKDSESIKLSLKTKIVKSIKSKIRLSSNEIADFASKLMISLLEADVSYDAAEHIVNSVKSYLESNDIESDNIEESLYSIVKSKIREILSKAESDIDILRLIKDKKEKPYVILFLGPNGAGKTTTIAKVAHMLKSDGISSVISASDTFRAAAIEQLEQHANALQIKLIKKGYNADPASVAFDAINYARAHGIDAVLIDTAGRQDTNKNLLNELNKIYRISKPDLTVYVGEATASSDIVNAVSEFSKFIRIDALILTKIDTDTKGGSLISLAYSLAKPIIYLGNGQDYSDIIKFSSDIIIERLT